MLLYTIKFPTHLVFADFDTCCRTGGPSVQVLACGGFAGHMKGQNETARENPAQGVVHLRRNAVQGQCCV